MTTMFKCPVCKRLHPINLQTADLDEMTCTDNETSELHQIKGYKTDDALTGSDWNFNKTDTRVSGYSNDAQLINLSIHNPHPRRVKNW